MSKPSIAAIARFGLVTADIEACEAFFVEAFDGVVIERREGDESDAALLGLPGTAIRESLVRLGDQMIVLRTVEPSGRSYPAGSTSTDLWFQHFAIIVSDMEAAYARLQKVGRFTPISEDGPQTLPPSSGSVEAFKFRDAEGHPLEFLAFPAGEGPEVWQAKRSSGLFLGIDHSAISVGDTVRSIAFFEGAFGLILGAQTENTGIEQSRMDAVSDARVTVTGLEPAATPPHVELLGYKVGSRRPIDAATTSADIAATEFVLATSDLDAVVEALTARSARFVSPGIVALRDGGRAIMALDPSSRRPSTFVLYRSPSKENVRQSAVT